MPFRSVTHQLKSKWQQKRASRAKSVDLPTPPSTDNETAHPPTLQQLQLQQQQQQQQQEQEQQNTGTTTKQDDKRKKGKDLPPSPDYLLAGIGDYLFDRPLGHGKFSKVMLAKHYLTGEQYAIKVIDKRLHEYRVMSRLVREIRLMEALDHPNVVHLYETVETADSLYLVMEYVPGFNLDEHLQKRHGLLHEDEARLIFRQMVAAVDYCHSRWVVHRDLKAPNVLLKTNGQVKLADFGLGNRFGLQRLRTMCGSMLYYSPEIICEQKYIGPEVDCWCLGVTLFRMTSGFEPFSHARTFGELRKDVIDGNYPMPTHFSEGLQQTIRKCLSVDRRRRIALRVALKDDPWLNDNGRMKDLFLEKGSGYYGGFDIDEPLMIHGVPTELDENVRHRMERERSKRQCLKDMEEEKQSGQHVKKTVIYHPINTSIYFTGNAAYSPRMEENTQTQELLRAELLAEMKTVLAQVQLTPISQPPSGHSTIQQFFHKLKRPESILALSSAAYSSNDASSAYLSPPGGNNGDNGNSGGGFSSRLKKTTSTLSLASLYTRPKEHINYYTIQTNLRGSSSATVLSSFSSSSSLSGSHSLSFPSVPPTTTTGSVPISARTTRHSLQQPLYGDLSLQQDECELILLVQSACQLLGVTYQHEGRTKLTCVLTLRNYAMENQQQSQQQQQQQQQQAEQQQQQSSSVQSSSQRRSSRWLQGWRDNGRNDGVLEDSENGNQHKLKKKKSRFALKGASSSPNLLNDAAAASSTSSRQQQQQQQQQQQYYGGAAVGGSSTYTSRSSMLDRISNGSNTSRWSRQMKRLSAPFQQWPWSSHSVHLHSSMPIHGGPSQTYAGKTGSGATTATFGQLKITNNQQQQTLEVTEDDDGGDEKSQNRDGIVIFTMEAYSIPNNNNKKHSSGPGADVDHSSPHVVALRFVKIKGSSKVYKLATGWISGVLSSSVSSSISGGTPTSSSMNVV